MKRARQIVVVVMTHSEEIFQLVKSLAEQIERYPVTNLALLVIDNHAGRDIESKLAYISEYVSDFRYYSFDKLGTMGIAADHLPLGQTNNVWFARYLAYIALLNSKYDSDAIYWMLDDDLTFESVEISLTGVLKPVFHDYFHQLRILADKLFCLDAAIGLTSYAPPIPSLLYMNKTMTDLLEYDAEGKYVSERGTWGWGTTENYHDLYPSLSPPCRIEPIGVGINDHTLYDLMRGVPFTRPLVHQGIELNGWVPEQANLRGANYIVFNRECLRPSPQSLFVYEGRACRKSDIINAYIDVRERGLKIDYVPLCLRHNVRALSVTPEYIARKYMDDVYGAVAFRFLFEGKEAGERRFMLHGKHISSLIENMDKWKLHSGRSSLAECFTTVLERLLTEKLASEHLPSLFDALYDWKTSWKNDEDREGW